MKKMLVLTNHLDLENHLAEMEEIAKTHEIARTFLVKVSPDFGSRVRSILAPNKLDLAARMSDASNSEYLSRVVGVLREHGMDSEFIGTSLSEKALDDLIQKNNFDLILTSDGRSGLCRWPGGSLVGRHAQFLRTQAYNRERAVFAREEKTKPDVKKMLVLLDRLDIEERLPELRDIIMAQEVEKVYLASASGVAGGRSQYSVESQESHPVERMVVYLARATRTFGSRVRSRVSPQKLETAARMGDAIAGKYLLGVANTLARKGIEAIPIGISIPADKITEYIERNAIDIVVTGDGRSGLCSWPRESFTGRGLPSVFEEVFAEEQVSLERLKAKVRQGFGTIPGIALQFSSLFLFWLFLSGNYHLEYILFGAASAALVTHLTNGLVFSSFSNPGKREGLLPPISKLGRFLAYIPALFIRIVLANWQVAYLVLHPKMPIDPALLIFQNKMQRSSAQVLLANSITLTPGTVTLDLKNGEYTIHALVTLSVYELITGQMQNRVGAIFGEAWEEPPDASFLLSISDLKQ